MKRLRSIGSYLTSGVVAEAARIAGQSVHFLFFELFSELVDEAINGGVFCRTKAAELSAIITKE